MTVLLLHVALFSILNDSSYNESLRGIHLTETGFFHLFGSTLDDGFSVVLEVSG